MLFFLKVWVIAYQEVSKISMMIGFLLLNFKISFVWKWGVFAYIIGIIIETILNI